MSDLNNLTIVGRLTKDATLKYLNSGTAVSNFSIANNYHKEKEANFFDVTLFGSIAESLDMYLKKSQQVGITGEIRHTKWNSNGEQRSRVYIIAHSIQLLGKRPDA